MASTFEAELLASTAQLAVPVIATPTSTNSTGSVTSGTTETFDTVLGYYQASLIAGRRYMAVMNGYVAGGTAAADLFDIRIRNSGSSSNPTTSSTIVAMTQFYVSATGGPGQVTVYIQASFLAPATGLNTFGVSAQRIVGSGTLTPFSSGVPRELYVMYLGAV
jgi:hypothetical protein